MIHRIERFAGVHPALVFLVCAGAQRLPFDLFILEGIRTIERQRDLVASGASRTLNSRHLTGHALDVAPYAPDADGALAVSWHWPHYHTIAAAFKAEILRYSLPVQWGGDWRTFKDGPHWQLARLAAPADAQLTATYAPRIATIIEAATI